MQKSIFCIENKYLLRFIFSPLWQWQQTWLSGSGTIADGNFSQDHLDYHKNFKEYLADCSFKFENGTFLPSPFSTKASHRLGNRYYFEKLEKLFPFKTQALV
mgnify:CR=1 FL=1